MDVELICKKHFEISVAFVEYESFYFCNKTANITIRRNIFVCKLCLNSVEYFLQLVNFMIFYANHNIEF